jgi:hypothetical protein
MREKMLLAVAITITLYLVLKGSAPSARRLSLPTLMTNTIIKVISFHPEGGTGAMNQLGPG